jgi:hypothetical protein
LGGGGPPKNPEKTIQPDENEKKLSDFQAPQKISTKYGKKITVSQI